MPVNVEFPGHEKELKKLFDLRRVNRKIIKSLRHGNTDPVRGMVINVTRRIGAKWEQNAPRLTGTLASATRERVDGTEGLVFIDRGVVNPVFGGKPSTYGPIVHRRKPWIANVVRRDAPGILVDESKKFIRKLESEYESAK